MNEQNWKAEYERQRLLVIDWAAHNGLVALDEEDQTMAPEYEPRFLNVVCQLYLGMNGNLVGRPTVATLVVHHIRYIDDPEVIVASKVKVMLVRHGRSGAPAFVTADELARFGLEARHLDRID